ncbi:hypothetical protein [Halorhabdus sp. CUG00001]|uniref:hypothetical protein n=1 Tax=Halorhabdus sp. CUG00001 TaxID=2600297 RepID=UPI00131C897F|nr:hypothetical protein [Halorhabdus sp. CUG00001]
MIGRLQNMRMIVLMFGIKDTIRSIINDLFNTVFDFMLELFADLTNAFLTLDPAQLQPFEEIWTVGTLAFFSILTLYAASMLGLAQIFPGAQQTDPARFFSRALAATLSLWIVNPPDWGSDLFSKGAFGWAFVVVNEICTVYLDQVGTTFSFQSEALAGALGGGFILLGFAFFIGLPILVFEFVLLALLVARQVIVFFTYGLYPVLIVFWVADAGPLRYGKQLSSKLFKTAITALVGGILIAGIFTTGIALISGNSHVFGGGVVAQGVSGSAPVAEGVFATGSSSDYLTTIVFKLMVIGATCLLPTLMLVQMLGAIGGGITSVARLGAAVVSGGASVAASGAMMATKEMSKKGIKKGTKSAAKKSKKKAKQGIKDRANSAASTAAERANPVARGSGGTGSGGEKSVLKRNAPQLQQPQLSGGQFDGDESATDEDDETSGQSKYRRDNGR